MGKILSSIKKLGIRYTLYLIIKKIHNNFAKIIYFPFSIKDIIVIESHNDFDCNGGAIYDYLLRNNYNKRYKIVWLVTNEIYTNRNLPYNVLCLNYYKLSIVKEYYLNCAKYLFYDDKEIKKRKGKQKLIYCTHGGVTFKNVIGKIIVPDDVDYILSPSKRYDLLICKNYSIKWPNNRMLHIGYPANDVLFDQTVDDEVKKVTEDKYNKTILWMPTFRTSKSGRNDSAKEFPIGIPVFNHIESLRDFNRYLEQNKTLLIIKIHPFQDENSYIKLCNMSNIRIIDGKKAKELEINNYKLMKSCDALISDYSSSAYSYMLLDRQIGFVLSDLEDYKCGLLIDDYEKMLPGFKIYSMNDIYIFVDQVLKGIDSYAEERRDLTEWIYEYRDGKSSKRLIEFLGL